MTIFYRKFTGGDKYEECVMCHWTKEEKYTKQTSYSTEISEYKYNGNPCYLSYERKTKGRYYDHNYTFKCYFCSYAHISAGNGQCCCIYGFSGSSKGIGTPCAGCTTIQMPDGNACEPRWLGPICCSDNWLSLMGLITCTNDDICCLGFGTTPDYYVFPCCALKKDKTAMCSICGCINAETGGCLLCPTLHVDIKKSTNIKASGVIADKIQSYNVAHEIEPIAREVTKTIRGCINTEFTHIEYTNKLDESAAMKIIDDWALKVNGTQASAPMHEIMI